MLYLLHPATASINAVKGWVYEPFTLNGEPVAVETVVQVVYRMGY